MLAQEQEQVGHPRHPLSNETQSRRAACKDSGTKVTNACQVSEDRERKQTESPHTYCSRDWLSFSALVIVFRDQTTKTVRRGRCIGSRATLRNPVIACQAWNGGKSQGTLKTGGWTFGHLSGEMASGFG